MSRSVSEGPFDFEITRVDCNNKMSDLANNCVVYLMYDPVRVGVSEEGMKMTKTSQRFRKSFGIQRMQCISNKTAFIYFEDHVF